MKQMTVRGKQITFPIFCPDATRGVVRAVDMQDMSGVGVEGLIMNTYHLLTRPGSEFIESIGGLKKFTGWEDLIITDSGGFQVLSLVYGSQPGAKIDDDGVTFVHEAREGRVKMRLTPETCIQTQFAFDSDIMICLDDCPPLESSPQQHRAGIERTISWAQRCKTEYLAQLAKRGMTIESPERPLLFAVVQGGSDMELRRYCFEHLAEIGFDGYGYGGWPILPDGTLDVAIVDGLAALIGPDVPKYALGVGMPADIARCVQAGWEIFDCVLPTRDARHGRLYVGTAQKPEFLYINKTQYVHDMEPIDQACDCPVCSRYSRAYLHHLFKIEDMLAPRLATLHNLRHYARVIDALRQS